MKRHSLDKKILFWIFCISSTVTLVITLIQLISEYRVDLNQLDKKFDVIQDSQLSSIAESLWDYNREYLTLQIQGVINLPDFTYAVITNPSGNKEIELGKESPSEKIVRDFLLHKVKDGRTHNLGILKVEATLDNIHDRATQRVLMLLISNGCKTFIVSTFILFLIRLKVIRPLQEIASHLLNLREDNRNTELALGKGKTKDEFDSLVDAVNLMSSDLDKQISHFKDYSNELEDKVQDQHRQITEALSQKTVLLRMMCHDISNPLSVVTGYVGALKSEATEMDSDSLNKILGKIDRASQIINDIVCQVKEYEALESGKRYLDLEPVHIDEIVRDIKIVFEERFKAKNINFIFEDDLGGVQCMADSHALKNQVLSNLISNAIKFSNNDCNIYLRTTREGDDVVIQVRDEGIGIPAKLLKKIFDTGASTSRKGTSGETGTGFGMPLVKAYLEKLGGSIAVESKCVSDSPDDHGTLITVKLKVAAENRELIGA